MARKLVALLATLLLCTTAFAKDAPLTNQETFDYACEYLDVFYGVSCENIEPPVIVTSRVVDSRYYGFYFPGEPYIFVNKRLWLHDKEKWYETVAHEGTHYILREAGYEVTRCKSEEIARRVHHSWSNTKYNDNWRDRYRC